MMKAYYKALLAIALLLAPVASMAREPDLNVSGMRYPQLAAAQQLSRQAYDRLNAAQWAMRSDMGGHAASAKQLLLQVNREIRLAADSANRR